MNHGDFQQFARGQRGQDRWQPRRQHGLARAGRAAHQQVVAASGGDFERALGALLPLDVTQVGLAARAAPDARLGPGHDLRPLEMIGELDERARRENIDLGRGPRRLRPTIIGADQAVTARVGGDGGGQRAGDRGDRAIERQFADDRVALERIGRNGADGRHDPQRDRQVVMATFLGHVGGREIDGDPPRRQGQPARHQRRTHPFAGLAHRLVGQPDEREFHVAVGNLHLNVDWPGLDALERQCRHTHDHGTLPRAG